MPSDPDTSHATTGIIFVDIDGNPITTDNNPTHFEGLLYEISEYCSRTGKFLPLVEQGIVTTSGGKTITDSIAAIPFVLRSVTGAKNYDFFDPCPPTVKRIVSASRLTTLRLRSRALLRSPP